MTEPAADELATGAEAEAQQTYVYQVQTNSLKPDGQRRTITIETTHGSLAEIAEDLRNGPIVVTQIFTKCIAGSHDLEIVGSRPLLITCSYVFCVLHANENRKYVIYDDVPAEVADAP